MKKCFCFAMVTILLFLLEGCGNSNSSSVIEETTEDVVDTTVEPTTEKPTEPPTTEPPQLSESCNMVLASGYDGDDYYQLVANETEDYNGVKDELGVIKNNEWLLKPTLDMPFVNDDGSMKGVKNIYGIDNQNIFYLGNSCFYYHITTSRRYASDLYKDIFFNAEINKYYEQDSSSCVANIDYGSMNQEPNFSFTHYINEDEPMVIVDFSKTSSSDGVAKILNTNTMETSELVINKLDEFSFFNLSTVYPISENKFAVSFVGKKICFYDLDGNQLFDTTNYKLSTYDQDITFKDDKCSFTIKNNGGTLYNITINSKGEVIDSYEVSE